MAWDGRCRHHRFWLFDRCLWCYECGAFRLARLHEPTPEDPRARIITMGGWLKPVGHGGENPRFRKLVRSRRKP